MATQTTIDRLKCRNVFSARWMLFMLFSLAATSAPAALIDFETTPSGATPIADSLLSTPYVQGPLSMTFSFFDPVSGLSSDPVFEEIGLQALETPLTGGFLGSVGPDTADAGFEPQLGDWFLRGPTGASDFGLMVITYSGPLPTAASGEIWDIDGNPPPNGTGVTEEYTLRAYDAASNLLATLVSPLGVLDTFDPASLDGQPWVFSFSGLAPGIKTITIDFTGTKTIGIGLAFNNFDPTSPAVPEPAALSIGLIGLAIASLRHRRRQDGSGELSCGA